MNWRQEIERRLRRPLKEWEWTGLVEEGYEEDLESKVTTLEILIREQFPQSTPVGKHPLDEPLSVSDPIVKRARVLAKLYARMAEEDPWVQAVRKEIDPATTTDNLGSWITRQRYEALGIDDPGEAEVATQSLLGSRVPTVTFANPEGEDFPVPTDSLLGEIAQVVERLTGKYPWRADRATRWLVVGGPPPMVVNATIGYKIDGISSFDTMAVSFVGGTDAGRRRFVESMQPPTDTRTRITLTVDPAITPKEVARLYSAARAPIAPTRVRAIGARLSKDEKALALAGFILDQSEDWEDPSRDTWNAWLTRWNEGPGRTLGSYEKAGTGPDRFRRAARDALRRLRYVGWHPSH